MQDIRLTMSVRNSCTHAHTDRRRNEHSPPATTLAEV